MRQLLIAAASAVAALTLISCDPPMIEIKDNSALEKVTLTASNDTPKWEFGEERTITILPSPATAICDKFSLTVSNPEIITVRDGEVPNQFKLTSNGEGKVIITGYAIGHNDEGPVEKSDYLEFTLQDNRVKPKRPVVSLKMAPMTDINSKKELAEDVPAIIDDDQELLLTVISDSERATYSIKSLDTEVFSVERTGAQSWMFKTKTPGRDFLKLTVTDAEGNPFDYYYLIYSFGHVVMTAEYDPLMGEGGISIAEHNYPKLTGQVYMAGVIKGWPWNDVNNIVERELPTFSGELNFSEELEHLALIDAESIQKEIQNMTVGEGLDKAWFNIHEVKLNYIISLSNPFIIIADMIDDSHRSDPLWWNFWIEGAYQQEGLEPVIMLSHDPISFSAGVDGWNDGTEYTIPL